MSEEIVRYMGLAGSGKKILMPMCAVCGIRVPFVKMRTENGFLVATVKCHNNTQVVRIDMSTTNEIIEFGTAFEEAAVVYAPDGKINPKHSTFPVIFLAGPVQGTEDWRESAIELAHSIDPSIVLCSPKWHKSNTTKTKLTDSEYKQQVEWESTFLKTAAAKGSILFWLAKETKPIMGRSYAQTTRYELAEWLTISALTQGRVSVVVGIEKGFSGERYIRTRSTVAVHDNIKDTVVNAVQAAKRKIDMLDGQVR